MYRAPTVPKKKLPPVNESDEEADEVSENFSQAPEDFQSNASFVHSEYQTNDVSIDASQAISQAMNTQISVSYEQSNAVVMIQTNDEAVEALPAEDLNEEVVEELPQATEISHNDVDSPHLDQQKRPSTVMSQAMFNQNFASQGSANAVAMNQSGDVGSKSNWDALINSTYYVLMAHAKNKLSVIPDPDYPSKLEKWHTLVKQNKANVGSLMEFVVNSAHEFGKSADANRSVTRGLELAEEMFTRGKSSSSTAPNKTMSSSSSPQTKKRKKNERYCRACKSYFVFSRADQNICDKRECQARRCTHCDEDRVKSRGDKCKACYEGK